MWGGLQRAFLREMDVLISVHGDAFGSGGWTTNADGRDHILQAFVTPVCVCAYPDPGVVSDCDSERLLMRRDQPGLISGS